MNVILLTPIAYIIAGRYRCVIYALHASHFRRVNKRIKNTPMSHGTVAKYELLARK